MELTQARLKELLHYDPETGHFTWLVKVGCVTPGRRAGTKHSGGYVQMKLDGRFYLAHRLAWLYETGSWPPDQIDHVNGIRSDNRICNLRPATPTQNCCNARVRTKSTSGYKGVCWVARDKRWMASITVNKKTEYLGYFKTAEQAHAAYVEAASRLHGKFARAA